MCSAEDMYDTLQDQNFRAEVYPNGDVHYWVAGKLMTSCVLDLTYFPFDAQACYYHINGWAYDSQSIALKYIKDKIDILNEHNPQWKIVDSMATQDSYHAPDGAIYTSLIFTIHLQRKPQFYISTMVMPCTLLSILALLMFCLPAAAGEKVSLGITVLLAFSVFQLLIADIMPRTSDQVALICEYILHELNLILVLVRCNISMISYDKINAKFMMALALGRCISTIKLHYGFLHFN